MILLPPIRAAALASAIVAASATAAAAGHRHSSSHARSGTIHSVHQARSGALRTAHESRGRPGAWCGWWLRRQLKVADNRLNQACAWRSWGKPGKPGVGAVVVWCNGNHHHVGRIVGRAGDRWVVQSGNDGHAVRSRPRSVLGASFRWGMS